MVRASADVTSLSRVEIDLGALRHNFAVVRGRSGGEVLAVIKADAYGHGAVAVARALAGQDGLAGLVVARIEEAVELRQHGVGGRLLLLGSLLTALEAPARHELAQLLSEQRVEVVVGSLGELRALAESTWEGGDVAVHLKIDTGMSRAGLAAEELEAARQLLSSAEGLRWVGLLSHLAESERLEADGADAGPDTGADDGDFTAEQQERFERVIASLAEGERSKLEIHLANSAAALYRPALQRRCVRVGGALYGLDVAAGEAGERSAELRPVMSVRSAITQVREIAPGTPVGYGRTWTARRRSLIALVPIGYADGYPSRVEKARALTAWGEAPLVGKVSMDLICLDVTGLGVEVGDEVTVLGELGGERVSAADLGAWSGDVLYEVTCRFSRRLPRLFVGRDGGRSGRVGAPSPPGRGSG